MRPTRQLLLTCLLVAAALLVAGCVATVSPGDGADDAGDAEDANVRRTTIIPTMRPTSAADLGIVLDPSGRPFDNYWGPQGTTVETRFLTRMQIDGGRVELIAGEELYAPAPITLRDTLSVNFRDADRLELYVVWQRRPSADEGSSRIEESILGVRLSVPGSTVARWDSFRDAYETTEGLGGITSRAVLERSELNLDPQLPLIDTELAEHRNFVLDDADGEPGNDVFLFDNGTDGVDGEYPITRGFDEDDRMVAIMLWDERFPWRLAVSAGEPPPDITEREEELADCIAGRRLIDKWGRCT